MCVCLCVIDNAVSVSDVHIININICIVLLVNDSSMRGGFMMNFLDDGQGMTSGKKPLCYFQYLL